MFTGETIKWGKYQVGKREGRRGIGEKRVWGSNIPSSLNLLIFLCRSACMSSLSPDMDGPTRLNGSDAGATISTKILPN